MKKKNAPSSKFRLTILLLSLLSLAFITTSFLLKGKPNPITCANSISCIKDLSGRPTNATTGVFMGRLVQIPSLNSMLAQKTLASVAVLGTTAVPATEKQIYVDLTHQRLYAFEGDKLVYNFLISSGKWNPTPDGVFHIWIKLRATRMTGGEGADYYDLPNVPYVMFFSNDQVPESEGFSLHGAYWHNNFGHPMSHGCVNLRIEDAKVLYDWTTPATTGYTTYATTDDPGTQITIFGTAPTD